ncbi:MAG: hypothetical protein KDA46_12330 [Parvularculaceae bacterium]|nr:hypothetical protein [Parvularculaceae bacterium]
MTNFTDAELRARIATQKRKHQCRNAYQRFLADQRPDAFVTLALNSGPKQLNHLTEKLKKWAFLMDRALNNNPRRLQRLPSERRLNGWFVAEKQKTNGHLHGLINLPEHYLSGEWRFLQLQTVLDQQWCQCVPSGDVKIEPIFDAHGVADYCLKEAFHGDDFFGSLVELADFWPAPKPQPSA